MSGARSPRPRPAAAVMPTPLETPPSLRSITNQSDPLNVRGTWRPLLRAARRPASPTGLDRDALPRRVRLAPVDRHPAPVAVAPLTCPAHVGSWAGPLAVGDLVVGDE